MVRRCVGFLQLILAVKKEQKAEERIAYSKQKDFMREDNFKYQVMFGIGNSLP
jgi:hypothetical protein